MAKSWTFGQRLSAGFGLVVVLTVIMGLLGFYALRTVVDSKDHVITQTARDLVDAQKMTVAIKTRVGAVRGYLLTDDARYLDEARKADADFLEAQRRMRDRATSSEAKQRLATVESSLGEYRDAADRVIRLRKSGAALESVVTVFEESVIPPFETMLRTVFDFAAATEQVLQEERQEASASASTAMALLLGLGAGTVALAVLLALVLTRSLSRQIASSVQHVRSSSAELKVAATQQASGSREQATAMTEITTTVGELLATSRQIAESAQRVAKIAADTADGARTGDQGVKSTQDAVGGIRQQVETIVEHMLDLGKRSQQIGSILEIINELSEQTNILAINAMIEASGAGESGRRFAVVGEEIRKLADRTSGSTKEIRSLIEEIRAAVNTTVMATESGSKAVELGAQRFSELATAFRRIGELVETTTQAAREIELSTKQQTTAVEQVNVAISNAAQATREAEAGSSQTLQTASQLAALSDELARLVQARSAAAS
ncbi:MAG TPA: methyl-accepting chemotaxis protein [Polyangiaceae bacterium]